MEEINYSKGPLIKGHESIDTTSSAALSAERQRQEREQQKQRIEQKKQEQKMQENLDEFLKIQQQEQLNFEGEPIDIFPDEESQLSKILEESRASADEAEQLTSQEDLTIAKEETKIETINTLESLSRLVPESNRDDDNVLKIVSGVPTFAQGTLPTATNEGYVLIVIEDPDDSSAVKWAAQPLQWNNVPS
jgi:hypothetical protein|tara:strand:- start:2728 stop:3300 length:573 start_codon:yes stop_codon:yes gene_type:complete